MARTFIGILVLMTPALAQPLGAGFKVGVPFTDAYRIRNVQTILPFAPFTAEGSNYTFGPYVELRLPARMSIEVDALYRQHNFLTATGGANTSSWEFPVVVKHKFTDGLLRPYFEGGLSFGRLSDIRTVNFNHLSNYGLVVGGGVEINALLLKISPEVRYTGWGFKMLDAGNAESRRNQLAFLVGFGF